MRSWLSTGPLFLALSGSLAACVAPAADDDAPPAPGEARVAAPAEDADAFRGEASAARVQVPYPAPHPSMPQIPSHGGAVLDSPVLVGVTFPGDPLADRIRAFDEEVTSLGWWPAVTAPYGVGAGSHGGHVSIQEALPDTMSDAEVESWIAKKVADGTLPAPTDQTLYLLYVPEATTVTLDGAASCRQFLGFHSAATVRVRGAEMRVAYAVVNRCRDLDQVTETSSHEIAEAVSDPHPIDVQSLGYMLLESNAWTLLGGENADMCSGVAGVTENGWALTRVWKNDSAARGEQPCVPDVPSEVPYFNAGIVDDTMAAHAGATVTTEVDCYSFGPLPGPMELGIQVYGKGGATFGLDRRTCNNGDRLTLTINVPVGARRGTDYHYNLVAKVAGGTAHLWRGMVHVR